MTPLPEAGDADGLLEAAAERIAHAVDPGSRLLGIQRLAGGQSSEVLAMDVELASGQRVRRIVRRHGDANLFRDPDTAEHEFRLLRVLHGRGLPVPEALHVDTSGELLPTPFVVLGFVEGSTEIAPEDLDGALDAMADRLLAIHTIDADDPDVSFVLDHARLLGWWLEHPPEELDAGMTEGTIRQSLIRAWPIPTSGRRVLLHGDYWPRNVLWREGRIVAVLDWEDAARGDPLADVAIARLDLVWAFGEEAAERFTGRYLAASSLDARTLPLWDLAAALRPTGELIEWADGDPARAAEMHGLHSAFTANALARSGIGGHGR